LYFSYIYGNISVGVTVGVGIPDNVASLSATIDHNFGTGNTYLSLGVGAGGFYANVGWGTQTGYTAGAGFGLSMENGFSTNLTSIGVGWSQNGGANAHASGFSFGANGTSFNMSVSYGHAFNLKEVFGDTADAGVLPTIYVIDKWIHQPTTRYLNYLQTGLDIIGLVPVFGEAADLINAGIYAARGQYGMMSMSIGAALPFAGWAFSGGKFASKGSSYIYRAVSKAELDDIAQFGLRTKSGGYETAKLFAPTAKEASQFGRNNFKFDKISNTIIKVKIPNSILQSSYKFTADGMNAISIQASLLSHLKATPLNYSVFK